MAENGVFVEVHASEETSAPGTPGVSGHVLGVARYRFRATFGRRWGSYLTFVLLIGLVGGLGMGAIAAARRTQSSFSTFLASTNPPDLTVTIFGANANNASSNPSYSTRLTREIARLPYVRTVHVGVLLTAAPLDRSGAPRIKTVGLAYPVASVDGLFFTQDRVAVTRGHMADPDRPHEIMMTALAAQQLGYHLGETIPYGVYSQQQQELPGFGTTAVRPIVAFRAKLVGFASPRTVTRLSGLPWGLFGNAARKGSGTGDRSAVPEAGPE